MTVIAEECKATSIANHRVENRVNTLAAHTDEAGNSDGFEPLESNDDISHDYGELPSTHSKGMEDCSSTKEENGSAIWNVGNERKVIGEECKTLSIANDGVENGVSILAADTDEAADSDGFEPLESNDDISHDYGELPSTDSKGIEDCSSTKEENGSAIWNVGNEMKVISEECKTLSIANDEVENSVSILAADTDKAADSDGFEPLESNDDISHDYGELPSTHSKGMEDCSSTKEENGSAIWNVGNEMKVIGEECKTLSIANDGVENSVSILAADTDKAADSDGFEPLESNDDISHDYGELPSTHSKGMEDCSSTKEENGSAIWNVGNEMKVIGEECKTLSIANDGVENSVSILAADTDKAADSDGFEPLESNDDISHDYGELPSTHSKGMEACKSAKEENGSARRSKKHRKRGTRRRDESSKGLFLVFRKNNVLIVQSSFNDNPQYMKNMNPVSTTGPIKLLLDTKIYFSFTLHSYS